MADIKEIGIMGEVYNIKDAYSRERLFPLQRNKKIIFIGDSYLEGYSSSRIYKSWGAYVAENFNTPYISRYEGGAGFAANGQQGHNFKALLETKSSEKDITDIVVCGGYNDKNKSRADIIAGIRSFVDYAKETWKEANVWIGFIGWAQNITSTQDFNNAIEAYIKGAGYCGVSYLTDVEQIMHNYTYYGDSIHPNESGHTELGNAITRAMTNGTGKMIMNDFVSFSITPATGVSITNNAIYQKAYNGMVFTYININKFTLSGTVRTGLNPDQKILLGTYNSPIFKGNKYVFAHTPMACFNEGTAYNGTCTYILDNGKLYCHIDPCKSNGWITGEIGAVYVLPTSTLSPMFYE